MSGFALATRRIADRDATLRQFVHRDFDARVNQLPGEGSSLDVGRVLITDRIIVLESLDGRGVGSLHPNGDIFLAAGHRPGFGHHGAQQGLLLKRLRAHGRRFVVVIDRGIRDVFQLSL